MNDPVDERLRSYYRSIQRDAPAHLETSVNRAFDAAVAPAKPAWRLAFGLLAAALVGALLVAALVVHGLGVIPGPTSSDAVGPTALPSASASATSASTASPLPTGAVPPTTVVASATPAATPAATQPAASHFSLTGSMTTGRDGPTATLLDTGKVLVAGGRGQTGSVAMVVATAELYDPATGKFTRTGSMAAERWGHSATLLNDGRVLITGGADFSDGADNLKTAELYDPATGRFTATGSMSVGRALHTATLLGDGRVLVAGGTYSIGLDSAEIYDPATGRFTPTGSMTIARQRQTATLLADGRVLIAGGIANGADGPFGVQGSAELYDPNAGTFKATGSMAAAREGARATLLADGSVLIVGGFDQNSAALNSAERYDPAHGKFAAVGAVPAGTKPLAATVLADGSVLVVGPMASGASAAVYDPATHIFHAAGTAKLAIGCQTATLLTDGRVLLLGGVGANGRPIAAAGLYKP
jgi:hypothetical protein